MNDKGFFLATVKPAGVAHSEDPDDDFVRAKSSAIKFDTVSGAGDQGWTIILDDGEYVEGIALGENWCYAATDRGLIRVVTHAGYQLYIFSYPGPFLAIAASSHLMMLTYHQSEPFDGNADFCSYFSALPSVIGFGLNDLFENGLFFATLLNSGTSRNQ